MKDLYILGAGSVGGHLATNIKSYTQDYNIVGFFDDDDKKVGKLFCGYPVLGSINEAILLKNVSLFLGIAFPQVKRNIIQKFSASSEIIFPSFIHQTAWVSNEVEVGKGSIIYPGVSINYASKIGDFVVVNMNCAIGHHTVIGSCTSFAPLVSTGGHTIIGNGVDVGIGVSTLQSVNIGDDSVVGGQSMVTTSFPTNSKIIGIPARQKKL
jgi:sugar O-acyltransferase (sialic acid O-acetyltransferase NeuD family)